MELNMRNNRDDYLSRLGESYLMDLIHLLKHEAFESINRHYNAENAFANGTKFVFDPEDEDDEKNGDNALSQYDRGYLRGYAHAYSRVISIMLKQADIFDIPLKELYLEDIDPDEDLLPGV